MKDSSLMVKNLSVPFGREQKATSRGLQGLSFVVAPGDFVGLVGPNGSGKSTLLKTIAGFLRHTSGSIYHGGTCLDHLPPHKRAETVILVEQEEGVALPSYMRIGEILSLWDSHEQSLLGFQDWRSQKETLGELVGEYLPHLSPRLEDQVITLSGGEMQLLSLACIRARLRVRASSVPRQEGVLLLDEHVASLELSLANEVMLASRALTHQFNLCTIVVTHAVSLLRRHADRILHLSNDGILEG